MSEKIGQLKMKYKFYKADIAHNGTAFQGGNIAKLAKDELESKTGKKVITNQNAKHILGNQKKIE